MPAELRTNRRVREEAIGWVIRLRDAGEQDWEAFTAWLEADPAHSAAYDEAAIADEEAEQLPPALEREPIRSITPPESPPEIVRHIPRRSFVGWAAAASILLSAGYLALAGGDGSYVVETAAGERRMIALEDGSRIDLNGGSRVELDPDRPRYAKLERGEALFDVVHDSNRPFEVEAGGALLRDMGTTFNVVTEKERLEVAVSEGVVLYDPGGAAKTLTPGLALRKEGAKPATVERVSTDVVGGWREGRLIYSSASIAAIAADLSRNLGLPIEAEETVASRPFSGVILLSGEPREVLERSALLLGLGLRRSGETWLLTRAGASP